MFIDLKPRLYLNVPHQRSWMPPHTIVVSNDFPIYNSSNGYFLHIFSSLRQISRFSPYNSIQLLISILCYSRQLRISIPIIADSRGNPCLYYIEAWKLLHGQQEIFADISAYTTSGTYVHSIARQPLIYMHILQARAMNIHVHTMAVSCGHICM